MKISLLALMLVTVSPTVIHASLLAEWWICAGLWGANWILGMGIIAIQTLNGKVAT